jgi:RNA methyltransferase, TrmH family
VRLELLALREGERFEADAERTVFLSRNLFRELSQTETPQGVLAVASAALQPFAAARKAAAEARWPLVALDGLQDPGNVGAILRTAAAAGAPALVVLPGTADPFGAKAMRASAGNVFRLVVAKATWAELKGLRSLGAAAHGGVAVERAHLEEAQALVLGGEARGLSQDRLELVSLPMAEGVESLNVAAAAAILLYEIRRRRA